MENYTQYKESYDRDGFVLVRNFLSPDEYEPLISVLERFIREVVPSIPDEAAFYQDKSRPETLKQMQHMAKFEPYFEEYSRHPKWNALASTLIGEEAHTAGPEWFNKPPQTDHPTPPHQDNFYFKLNPPNVASVWMAIDPVDEENGCLRYIPGSHLRGIRPHALTTVLGFSQGITDYGPKDEEMEVMVEMQPGDAVVHHAEIIHRADPNQSASRHRRALAMVYNGVSCKVDEEAKQLHIKEFKNQHREMGLDTRTPEAKVT